MHYGAYQEDDKILDSYVPFLREGYDRPITLRPNVILDTLRVSYRGLIQTLPRKVSARLSSVLAARGDEVRGVRDCFVARPGKVFYSIDFEGGELVTFAESAVHRVGYSDMGQALLAGVNVHGKLGAIMLGDEYGDFMKRLKAGDKRRGDFRQAAKPVNFGVPGSMGAVRIVLNKRQQGPDTPWPEGPTLVSDGDGGFVPGYKGLRFCLLVGGRQRCGEVKVTEWGSKGYRFNYPPTCKACIECSEDIRGIAFSTWSELRPYLDWHSRNAEDLGWTQCSYTGHVRGGIDYGSGANGDFQTLLAVIAKRAQVRVSYEQYCVKESVLYGSRSIVFAHDELFGECDEDRGHEVSLAVKEIMIDEFRAGCPNHEKACNAEETIMARWYKEAKPVYRAGRLVAWEPKRIAA